MPFLIPLLFTTGTAGWWWWSSKTEEPTFASEAFEVLKPFLIGLVVILLLRWLYVKGIAQKTK